MYDYEALIESATRHAIKTSGLSEVLLEAKMQSAYASILENAPEEEREKIEADLVERGFDPDFVGYQPEPGRCSRTRIDEDCCPCGWHR